ncbi:unnamed protein product [Schistocephalus solidus]|uniref:GDP-D-glucose phosphorylase 1 n=1 Tax=Schistocephalus solidus TaxID=70667 RepID=A0A183SSQ8_SCHSO|nr:unnamed protein product [Schistocephalus solidus]
MLQQMKLSPKNFAFVIKSISSEDAEIPMGVVLANVSPFTFGHSLLVPDPPKLFNQPLVTKPALPAFMELRQHCVDNFVFEFASISEYKATLDKLGGLHPEPNGLEEDSKDRGSNLRSQTDHRRQDQKGGTKFTSTPDQHRQCSSPSNVPALSTHLPRGNRPGRTPSEAMQQQYNFNFCQPSFGSPMIIPGTNSTTPTIITTTSQYSSPVTSTAIVFTTTSDGGLVLNCPHCYRTFTSRISLFAMAERTRTRLSVNIWSTPSSESGFVGPRSRVTYRLKPSVKYNSEDFRSNVDEAMPRYFSHFVLSLFLQTEVPDLSKAGFMFFFRHLWRVIESCQQLKIAHNLFAARNGQGVLRVVLWPRRSVLKAKAVGPAPGTVTSRGYNVAVAELAGMMLVADEATCAALRQEGALAAVLMNERLPDAELAELYSLLANRS